MSRLDDAASRFPSGVLSPQVVRVSCCDLRVAHEEWTFAAENAAAIEAHWSDKAAANPAMFNGTIHLASRLAIEDGVLSGTLVPTPFKDYLYWREQGFPETGRRDCFGSALIRSAEGHVLLGRQRAGGVNAGLAYPPGGFIDARDVGADGAVDIDASVAREIAEETGLDAALDADRGGVWHEVSEKTGLGSEPVSPGAAPIDADAAAANLDHAPNAAPTPSNLDRTLVRDSDGHQLARFPGYRVTFAGPLVSVAVEWRSPLGAEALRSRLLAHLAADPDPELTDIVIVRSMADVEATTPEYARALLGEVFGG